MTVRLMKIFIQVYQTQNITKAAALLHMTQPAVTRAVQEIEQYYGVRLFERINRRLSVTESGKRLYTQALHIVESFDLMEKGMRNWDEFGVLRIGASLTLGNFLLPKLIVEFQQKHPNLRLRTNVSNGAKIQHLLCENQLDLAFIEGGVSDSNLYTEAFTEDRLLLILPPDHPLLKKDHIYLRDLTDNDFLLREPGSAGRMLLDNVFASHGLPLEPTWESVSTHALINAVQAGLGISLLPEKLVQADIDAGTVCTRDLADETFARKNYIVWHKSKYLTDSAKELIALCRKHAGE